MILPWKPNFPVTQHFEFQALRIWLSPNMANNAMTMSAIAKINLQRCSLKASLLLVSWATATLYHSISSGPNWVVSRMKDVSCASSAASALSLAFIRVWMSTGAGQNSHILAAPNEPVPTSSDCRAKVVAVAAALTRRNVDRAAELVEALSLCSAL